MAVDRRGEHLGTDVVSAVVHRRADPAQQLGVVLGIGEPGLRLAPGLVDLPCGLEMPLRRTLLGRDPVAQRPRGGAGIADEPQVDGRAATDVRAVVVHLHDGDVLGVPVAVREIGAEHEQQVAPVQRGLRADVADEAGLAHLVRVVVIEAVLGLERDHHGGLQLLGEREDVLAALPRAAADEQRRLLRGVQEGDGPLERVRGGDGAGGELDEVRQPRHLELEPTDVAGDGEHRDATLGTGGVDGLLDQVGRLLGVGDGPGEHGDVGVEDVVVDLLEHVGAHLRGGHLAADGEHRRVGLLGVVQTVEQVHTTRTDGAHAHAERAGELRVGRRRERPRLLVAYADPLEALGTTDGVGDRVERVAHDAPGRGHPQVDERSDQHVGNGHGHV